MLWTSPAVADGGACPAGEACLLVTVTGTVNETLVVTATDLGDGDTGWHDMTNPPYRRNDGQNITKQPPGTATSIPAILRHLPTPVPVGSVTFATAHPFAGSAVVTRLGPADLADPTLPGDTGFQGHVVPGFNADNDAQLVRFTRPMRSDDDVNASDVWTSQADGQVQLVIHTTGHIVQPRVVAEKTQTDAGSPVSFHVEYDGAAPPGPSYTWRFEDGSAPATSATPDHTWGTAGSYRVTLDVSGSDGSEGSATPVLVQVGPKPPATTTTQPGTGTGGAANNVTGPVKGKGKTPGSTTSTQGSGAAGTGTSAGAGAGTGTGAGQAAQQGTDPQGKKKPAPTETTGENVSGTLLVQQVAAITPAAPSAQAPAASARAVPTPLHDWGLLWILVLPGLMLLGAVSQSRSLQRRLPRVPWRVT
ncbi:MAG: hypothetical protein JWO46_1189 [Nocardioidaceae bacterium]|nr:hypothetical protein [Nocardioidaceae bacterium]